MDDSRSHTLSSTNHNKDDVRMIYYNARSLVYKVDDLCVNCLLYKSDIVCITETWLDKDISNCEIAIPNFTLTRLDRNRHGGGIAIYVANHLSFSDVALGPFDMELSVKQPYGKLGISLLYRPPSAPAIFF